MPLLDSGWVGNASSHHSGTAILDFGATPASEASVTISGQIDILTTTRIRVWMADRSMSDNDIESHRMAGTFLRLVPSIAVNDTSFTIFATSLVGLVTGTFRLDYVWSA